MVIQTVSHKPVASHTCIRWNKCLTECQFNSNKNQQLMAFQWVRRTLTLAICSKINSFFCAGYVFVCVPHACARFHGRDWIQFVPMFEYVFLCSATVLVASCVSPSPMRLSYIQWLMYSLISHSTQNKLHLLWDFVFFYIFQFHNPFNKNVTKKMLLNILGHLQEYSSNWVESIQCTSNGRLLTIQQVNCERKT